MFFGVCLYGFKSLNPKEEEGRRGRGREKRRGNELAAAAVAPLCMDATFFVFRVFHSWAMSWSELTHHRMQRGSHEFTRREKRSAEYQELKGPAMQCRCR